MKKASLFVCSLAAVFALAGCSSKGTEVSAEDFETKAKALEAHEYTGAVVKYDIDMTVKETGEEDESIKESGSLEFTWSQGEFEAETGDSEAKKEVANFLNDGLADYVQQFNKQAEQYKGTEGIDVSVKYYVDPLGVEVKISGSGESEFEGMKEKASAKIECYAEFNEYGYVVKLEESYDIKGEMKAGGQTYEFSTEGSVKVTVEYK